MTIGKSLLIAAFLAACFANAFLHWGLTWLMCLVGFIVGIQLSRMSE